MSTNYTTEEEKILEENVNYVLGMYDLYQNDDEIIDALRLKGMDIFLITKVLYKIKQPACEKRLRQAKRMIISSGILSLSLLIIYFILSNLPGSSSFLNGNKSGESMPRIEFMIFRELFYFFCLVTVLQFLAGLLFYKKISEIMVQKRTLCLIKISLITQRLSFNLQCDYSFRYRRSYGSRHWLEAARIGKRRICCL